MNDDIDLDTIAQLKELLDDKFPTIVETFTVNGAKYIAAIQEGLGSGDAQKIVDAAHPLKSSSGNLGAAALSQLCAGIETQGKEIAVNGGDVSVLSDLIALAAKKFEASKVFLEGQF
ncbi:MAG: Hpt domain-containing protein [Alphaproteobacteria bacterium]